MTSFKFVAILSAITLPLSTIVTPSFGQDPVSEVNGDMSVNGKLTATSTTIPGTTADIFVLNSDNGTPDEESAVLSFSRGSETPAAEMTWNAALHRFEFNMPVSIPSLVFESVELTTLDVDGVSFTSLQGAGLTVIDGALTVDDAALSETFFRQGGNEFGAPVELGTSDANNLTLETDGDARVTVDAVGNVGIGTTTPASRLSVEGSVLFRGESLLAGTYGADMVDNGSFEVNLDGWTGDNWVHSVEGAEHVPGSAADLVQSATTAEVGHTYRVTYTVTAATEGTVQAYFGGVWGGQITEPGTYTFYVNATSEDALMFQPITSDFEGSISEVSVEELGYDGTFIVEKPTEFRTRILVGDRIDFADGMPISIGFEAMPGSTYGTYNQDSQNIAIGHRAGHRTTTGHVTAVGWRAGYSNTTGVLTAFGKNAGISNTDGHATFFGNYAGARNTLSESVCMGDEACADNTIGEVTAVGFYAGHTNVDGYVTAIGYQAAYENLTGTLTAVGYRAAFSSTGSAQSTLIGDSAGFHNVADDITAVGHMALYSGNTEALLGATAIGSFAGFSNQSGRITALGYRAGTANTTGHATIAGWQAGASNTAGHLTAFGYLAGHSNTTSESVVFGYQAGYTNTTVPMTAIGYNAGFSNTSGRLTALGHQAGYSNESGFATLLGYNAGFNNTSGDLIAIGYQAGYGASSANSPITDTKGILIGNQASRSVPSAMVLTNYIGIGDGVLIDSSNTVVLGNTDIAKTILNGNVGLGTAAPTSKLHVAADVTAPPSSTVYGQLEATGAGANSSRRLSLGYNTSDTSGFVQALSATSFDELLLNPSGGNVGVGTTSPTETLSVEGTVSFDGLTGAPGAGSLCLTADQEVVFNSGSDSCLPSTRFSKVDIRPLSGDALSLLKAVEPVSFAYRAAPGSGRLGFIAEDLATVDERLATHDGAGRISGLDATAVLAVVVDALKQSVERGDALEQRLTRLERRQSDLERENEELRRRSR